MIEPDTKDWTWVLSTPCPACGFVADDVRFAEVGYAIRSNAELWLTVLAGPAPSERATPDVWSATEYGCHVRDVHRIFGERVGRMLAEDAPHFAGWDQDATALEERYDMADPAAVAVELEDAAARVADLYDAVPDAARARPGHRSDGSAFTVDSIARYHLHDVVHHVWDVRRQLTVAAYDAWARAYGEASPALSAEGLAALDDYSARLSPGDHVLEIGSGGGRDALALEERGLRVRRTDVTPAFVDLLRAAGRDADVLDPLSDDLGGPYDGVWANASLLHVARADLASVLERLAAATRPGGVLRLSLKEGDGEGWSTHGSIEAPRMFTYWCEPDLTATLGGAGWRVEQTTSADGLRGGRWLMVVAYRSAA